MINIWHYLPPLASDYSGVSSILYGLNTLDILYTPSGCIHPIVEVDEIRNLSNSLLYKTNLKEIDVITGVDEKLLSEIEILMYDNKNVDFITLLGTPVSRITNIDFERIAKKLEKQLHKEVICFETSGFENYDVGIYNGLLKLANRFVVDADKKPMQINIIGYSSLARGDIKHLNDILIFIKEAGININIFAYQSIESIVNASKAVLNIGITAESIGVCEFLYERYHTPFEICLPVGVSGIQQYLEIIGNHLNINFSKQKEDLCLELLSLNEVALYEQMKVLIIADPLLCIALGNCFSKDLLFKDIRLVSNLKHTKKSRKMYKQDIFRDVVFGANEDTIKSCLDDADIVIADPLYMKLRNKEEKKRIFISIPQMGLSGNEYMHLDYAYIGIDGLKYFIKKINQNI